MEHPDIMPEIMDAVSKSARIRAALKMVENLTTEDIELVNERSPKLAEWALHQILNGEVA